MRKIVFTNISGGEGKTFLTFQVAHELKFLGYRVAVIDGDPQASLTKRFGLNDDGKTTKNAQTILSVWEGESELALLPPPLEVNGISIWPANSRLRDSDSMLNNRLLAYGNLYQAVQKIENDFDFLLIDTQPTNTALLVGLVAAANHMVVPISGDKGMENLNELLKVIQSAKMINSNIKLKIFVPNKVDNTSLSKEVRTSIKAYEEFGVISEPVRELVVGKESERARIGVVYYAKKSPLANEIRVLTQNIIEVTND